MKDFFPPISIIFSNVPALVLLFAMIFFKATYRYDEIADTVVSELQKRKEKAD